jgi:hypothetical protein
MGDLLRLPPPKPGRSRRRQQSDLTAATQEYRGPLSGGPFLLGGRGVDESGSTLSNWCSLQMADKIVMRSVVGYLTGAPPGARPRMQPEKPQAVRQGDPLPCHQFPTSDLLQRGSGWGRPHSSGMPALRKPTS